MLEEAIKELSSAIRVWTEALMRNNQLVEKLVAGREGAVAPEVKLPAPAAPTTRTVKTERGVTITGLPPPADAGEAPPPAAEAPAPAPKKAPAAPAAPAAEAAPAIPYADVRKAIIEFHKVHGNDGLKTLLAPYGATKGQELKPEQYAAVLAGIAKSAMEVA